MNKRVLLISVFVLMQYVIYGILGNWDNVLWTLYYHACPVFLVIGLLLLEILSPISKTLKFLCYGLIVVIGYYFLRLCSKYDIEYLEFMQNMTTDKPVYWIPVILALVLFLTIIRIKR